MSLFHGFGKHITNLTTVPEEIRVNAENTSYFAKAISLYNVGGGTVMARLNDNGAGLLLAAPSAVMIPPGQPFTFDGDNMVPIVSISLAAVSGTSEVYIAAY